MLDRSVIPCTYGGKPVVMTSASTTFMVDIEQTSGYYNASMEDDNDDGPVTHCTSGDLIGLFGILIQALLAVLAFSFLILKRQKEPHFKRRPWLVWFFDTSKQAFGALLIHFTNVILSSTIVPTTSKDNDPCSWYIVFFLLDSTVGLLCIYVGVKLTTEIVSRYKWTKLRFGEYGYPPKWDAWAYQCAIYLLISMIEKAVVTVLSYMRVFQELAIILRKPIHNAYVEVALVMLVIPFVVNAIMFWVVDNFLMTEQKKKKPKVPEIKVHYHHDKQNHHDGLNTSELEILLAMDEEELKRQNGNHLTGRI